MKRGSAADLLIRAVLAEAFRELALANPERAFEGFDLSEEEEEFRRRYWPSVVGSCRRPASCENRRTSSCDNV